MPKQAIDGDIRKKIRDARSMMDAVIKADGNEAETRRRVERIFGSLMGYDVLKHISREHAIKATGDTAEHCDFAVQVKGGENAKPAIMVEIKRGY